MCVSVCVLSVMGVIDLLPASLLWKPTWCILIPGNLVLDEQAFKSIPAWEPPLALHLNCLVSSVLRTEN